ncbi:unnamed protein product [Heterobilharzia americana]|nr:unnamed protein product [Heterobilharzia americana]
MSVYETSTQNCGRNSPGVFSHEDGSTTLIYGLPSMFTSEILYNGPKCIVKPGQDESSPSNNNKNSNGDSGTLLNTCRECREECHLDPVSHRHIDTPIPKNTRNSQKFPEVGSCDSAACLPESELSDIPLDSSGEDKKNFDVSDISNQLVLLSPFSGKKFASIHSENLYRMKAMSDINREKTGNGILSSTVPIQTTFYPMCSSVTMPSVEDGLSSGSDSLSPCYASRPRTIESSFNIHSISGSPDSVTDVYCGRPNGNSGTVSPIGETLLNPSLVRDISNDIRDIKRTLSAAEHTRTNIHSCEQKMASTVNANISTDQKTEVADSNEESNLQYTVSKVGMASAFSHQLSGVGEDITVKHTVQAVVECTDDNIPNQVLCDQVGGVNNILESPVDESDSYQYQQMHQWTFPAQVHTVYSSSEDEGSNGNTQLPPLKSQLKPRSGPGRGQSIRSPSPPVSSSQKEQRQMSRKPNHSGKLTMKSNSKNSTHANNVMDSVCKSSLSGHSDRRDGDFDSDEDTAQLLDKQYQADKQVYIPELKDKSCIQTDRQRRVREVSVRHPEHPDILIHGLLFRAQYMGSTQLMCNKHSTRMSRMIQAQEVVNRIKAPDEESQPSVTVELFVSTERIMILNANLEDILIDHTLRTVSYIADIGELFVLMSRRPDPTPSDLPENNNENTEEKEIKDIGISNGNTIKNNNDNQNSSSSERPVNSSDSNISELTKSTLEDLKKPTKMICHVLESAEAQLIAQTVGHAFQLAYLDFLKENGIEDLGIIKQLDYDDVLKQQEIFCDELSLFCDKDNHKEVTIPKQKGEALGVVIVESGWGSLLPTALLANMHPTGPAARCGQLNIGNQIVAVNGQSLVGLPLLTCQQIIKNCRSCATVKLMVINCPPVVEVLIRRPNLNYQLGFSVQDGVICSLLRGGIAERGGIRVDHRIIEINGESVVAVSHEKIVQLLATSVGEIHIRTMPTSVFRLLTGQIIPRYI